MYGALLDFFTAERLLTVALGLDLEGEHHGPIQPHTLTHSSPGHCSSAGTDDRPGLAHSAACRAQWRLGPADAGVLVRLVHVMWPTDGEDRTSTSKGRVVMGVMLLPLAVGVLALLVTSLDGAFT